MADLVPVGDVPEGRCELDRQRALAVSGPHAEHRHGSDRGDRHPGQGPQSPDAAPPERTQRDAAPGVVLGQEQGGDQVAGQHEKNVYPNISAGEP